MKISDLTSIRYYAERFNRHAAEDQLDSNVSYGPDDRNVLDVYGRTQESAKQPVVVFVHGGSWKRGSKDTYPFLGSAFNAKNYITVIPNYRLSPATTVSGMMEDLAAVIVWVRANIAQYGGDPDTIIIMGHSAGAHLGALLAHDDRYLTAAKVPHSCIRGFIGVSGIYNFSRRNSMGGLFDLTDTTQPWQAAQNITSTDVPSLLMHGRPDPIVPYRESVNYAKALQNKGNQVEMYLYSYLEHFSIVIAYATPMHWLAPVYRRTTHFIDRVTTK